MKTFICFHRCRKKQKINNDNLSDKETLHRPLNEQRKINNVYLSETRTHNSTTNLHNVTATIQYIQEKKNTWRTRQLLVSSIDEQPKEKKNNNKITDKIIKMGI